MSERLRPGEVDLGTSLIAIQYKGGVIIGADSRTSLGTYSTGRVSDKLTPLHDKIYCCRSGSAADTQACADIVRYYLQMYTVTNGEDPTVQAAAALFQEICYQNKDHLSAAILVAGWDKYEGASVYCIPLGGSIFKLPIATAGSGSTYIHGYCDTAFKLNMEREEAMEFAKTAIALAISRDGSSAGCIRLAVINETGVERFFYPGNKLPQFGVDLILN